ncbi:MAG: ABC transporter permease [Acidobacteria bacterium]|nr:ABC transporter permease [Acidobacteriota bacterium]
MGSLLQDLRYSVRTLRKSAGLTTVAVITLALGIGANTAIFSVVNAVLLRPLPYSEPERLVMVWESRPQEGVYDNPVAPQDFFDWRRRNQAFEDMSAFLYSTIDLSGAGEPERIATGIVSPSLFNVLGVQPLRGRTFLPEEEEDGRHRVVVMTYSLWQRRFGGDPAVVGKVLTLGGEPFEVIGVLPRTFDFPAPGLELWRPLVPTTQQMQTRTLHSMQVFARLKPGVTLERARADMDRVAAQLAQEFPESNAVHAAHVVPLREQVVGEVRPALLLLLGAVGFVLLIACANAANLLLARAAARQREFAVRAALGAGRWRLARQMLTESALLALVAGTAGVLLAIWGVEAVRSLIPDDIAVMGLRRIPVDGRVLVFTLGLSVLAGALSGVAPAFRGWRGGLTEALKEGGRAAGATPARQRIYAVLVVAETALALVLLAGAGLMIRTFVAFLNVNPGFDRHNLLTLQVAVPQTKYDQPAEVRGFFAQLLSDIQTLPGVETAGATMLLPLGGGDARRGIEVEGYEPRPEERTRAHLRVVTPTFFAAMRIPLLEGRLLAPPDTDGAPLVVLVNRTAAQRYWPGQSPVGRRLRIGSGEWREIVGVVADVKHWGLDAGVNPEMYLPFDQVAPPNMTVVVRSSSDPAELAKSVRARVRALDPDVPISQVSTMEEVLAFSLAPTRFYMVLLGSFAGLALLLASAGIYGVTAYSVARKTHEIGVRKALGARNSDIFRWVLRRGFTWTLAGLLLGAAGSLALTRFLSRLLFGVSPGDPLTLLGVAVLLAAVALLACWIPARRAMRVDPMVALRYE